MIFPSLGGLRGSDGGKGSKPVELLFFSSIMEKIMVSFLHFLLSPKMP
jgi:hypothetical protein